MRVVDVAVTESQLMQAFQRILVAVDTQSAVDVAPPELRRAAEIARNSDGQLHIVDIVRELNMAASLLPQWQAAHTKIAEEKLAALAELASQYQDSGIVVTYELLRGNYSQQLLKVIEQRQIDLLVRSAKGARSVEQGTIGSTSNQLLRQAPCALWLTQGDRASDCLRVVAAVDATPGDAAHASLNNVILERSLDIARREGCQLHIVYVWDIYDSDLLEARMPQAEFDELIKQNLACHSDSLEQLLSQHEIDRTAVEVHLLRGQPILAIPKFCQEQAVDLLVCGTVARTGLTGIMIGNTANRMLSRVPCSILALRP